jgi:hypothetical protein
MVPGVAHTNNQNINSKTTRLRAFFGDVFPFVGIVLA